MDRKVIIGLLGLGAAVLVLLPRVGVRRRRFALKGLGSSPDAHAERFNLTITEVKRALARGQAAAQTARCDDASEGIQQVSALLGQAKAERLGASGKNLPDLVTPLQRDFTALRTSYKVACPVVRLSPPPPSITTRAVGHLGSTSEAHQARFTTNFEDAERAIADGEIAVSRVMAAKKGVAPGEVPGRVSLLTDVDSRYHRNIRCMEAVGYIQEAAMRLGQARAERLGIGGRLLDGKVGPAIRDLNVLREDYRLACHVERPNTNPADVR